MTTTLTSLVYAIPELGGRVFRTSTFQTTQPMTPYALVYDAAGGVTMPLFGGADLAVAYPSVTIYHKPSATLKPQDVEDALNAIVAQLANAHRQFDTHLDGVTPYLFGSVQRGQPFPVLPDGSTQGQIYKTLRWSANYYRS